MRQQSTDIEVQIQGESGGFEFHHQDWAVVFVSILARHQGRRQGEFEGVRLNPLLEGPS